MSARSEKFILVVSFVLSVKTFEVRIFYRNSERKFPPNRKNRTELFWEKIILMELMITNDLFNYLRNIYSLIFWKFPRKMIFSFNLEGI